MKRYVFTAITFFAVVLLLILFATSVRCQTFGGGATFSGVSNTACLNGLIPITNTFFVPLPQKTVAVSGISYTSEVFTASFYLSLPGYTNAGFTNLYFLGSFTNSFATGTNGGSWSTNYPGGFVSIPFPLIMGGNTGNITNTNTVYVP